jgi:hypothetical protein
VPAAALPPTRRATPDDCCSGPPCSRQCLLRLAAGDVRPDYDIRPRKPRHAIAKQRGNAAQTSDRPLKCVGPERAPTRHAAVQRPSSQARRRERADAGADAAMAGSRRHGRAKGPQDRAAPVEYTLTPSGWRPLSSFATLPIGSNPACRSSLLASTSARAAPCHPQPACGSEQAAPELPTSPAHERSLAQPADRQLPSRG